MINYVACIGGVRDSTNHSAFMAFPIIRNSYSSLRKIVHRKSKECVKGEVDRSGTLDVAITNVCIIRPEDQSPLDDNQALE